MGPVTSLLAALCILIGMSAASPALPARPVTAITPINLSTESSGGQHPVMKLDAIGNVDVAWVMDGVFFRRSTDGGATFSATTDVQLNTDVIGLMMAVDASGINLLWYTSPDINTDRVSVFFSRSTNGGESFSAPKNLSTLLGIQSELLQLLLDSQGNIAVVWSDTMNPGLFFTRSVDAGATFSAAIKIFAVTGDVIGLDAVAGTQGQLYVFWSNEIGADCSILFSRATNGVTFSAAANVSAGTGTCNTNPESVVDSHGNLDVAWIAGNNVDFSRSVNQGATFSAPTNVSGGIQVFSTSDEKIAVDPSGNISVVWTATLSGLAVLFAESKDSGSTFSGPSIFSLPPRPSMTGAGDPAVGVGPANQISVAWDDDSFGSFPGDADIFVKTSEIGGALFSNATDVSNAGLTAQTIPQVMVDALGNTYIVWTSQPIVQSPGVFFAKIAPVVMPVREVRLGISAPVRSAPQGDVLHFGVSVREIRSHGEAVRLNCADLPAAMNCTFHPPSITPRLLGSGSSLTMNVPPTLALGKYVFAINGVGATSMDTQTVELTVTAPGVPASVAATTGFAAGTLQQEAGATLAAQEVFSLPSQRDKEPSISLLP
jgi:hypothetical protein